MVSINHPKLQEILNKQTKKSMMNLIEKLEDLPDVEPFLNPVNWKALGLTDYLEIVKTPMDLSTVKKKLKKDSYKKLVEVVNDINLIWSNCKLYNIDGSDIYNSAVFLQEKTNKLVNKFLEANPLDKKKGHKKKKLSVSKAPQEQIKDDEMCVDERESVFEKKSSEILKEDQSVDESTMDVDKPTELKTILPSDLPKFFSKLNKDGLALVVGLIEKNCSKALEDLDGERWILKEERLDKVTLNLITK